MYRIKLLLTEFLLLTFLCEIVQSQDKDHRKEKCGFNKAFQMQVEKDPTYLDKYNKLQKYVNDFVAQHPEGYSPKVLHTIPVVFHVILSSSQMSQMTDSRIQEQVLTLNQDFSGQSANSMGSFPASLKADVEIQFCLAQVDTLGNALTIPGINRRTSTHGAWGMSSDVKYTSKGGLNQWNPNNYLNIWVCEIGGSTLGYGLYPTGSLTPEWGLTLHWENVGLTGAVAPYNLGGTATHEIGHCFNLAHIWGDSGGCSPDDGYNDTPIQDVETYGNNTGVLTDVCTATSPGIMYINFMDYSDDAAMTNFTPNQKTVILALFASTGPLYQLTLSTACGPPPVTPVANFTAAPTTVLEGNSVVFTESSSNTPTSWTWSFPGGTPSTYSGQGPVTVTYNTPGPWDASLIVSNAAGSDTMIRLNYIHVNPLNSLLPEADFYAEQTTILVGGTTNFFDLTANGPTSWLWKFQGGIPATDNVQNPVGIQYNTAGNYKVTLTVANYNGSDSLIKTLYIHVISTYGTQRPTTAFTATQRLIVAGSTVYFTDQSTNNPASWSWTFSGLGVTPSSSNIQNPPGVVYSNPGYYNVKLKVTNPNGSDSLIKTEYIVVTQEQMFDYCDTISNVQLSENLYYQHLSSTSGYIPGPNSDGVKAYADKYTDYTFGEINSFVVGVKISKSASSSSYVRFKVWGGTTLPLDNQVLGSKDVLLNTMNPNFMKLVSFNPPIQVNGTFFVGYEVQYLQGDTFVVAMAVDRGNTGINTLYFKNSSSNWAPMNTSSYDINTSILINPSMCLVGINDIIVEEKLLIYPNPSQDKFNIQVEDDNWQDVEIRVFDMIGKIVESKADLISPHQFQIDMGNHKAGIYFLNIVKGNKSITKKISVIR